MSSSNSHDWKSGLSAPARDTVRGKAADDVSSIVHRQGGMVAHVGRPGWPTSISPGKDRVRRGDPDDRKRAP
ncbi:hypothetical protein GN956_G11965 [Arapaima gigas]